MPTAGERNRPSETKRRARRDGDTPFPTAKLSDATGGALTVRNYPGGELGAGPVEQYVRVLQGVADMGWGLQG